MPRGRKSAISLSLVPPALPGDRPAPPPELDDTEQRIWRSIVEGLPPTWFDTAAQQVLLRAVAQAAICERQEARLRQLRASTDPGAVDDLAAVHAAAAKALAHLLGVLRATPRARIVPRDATRQLARAPRVRPWEATAAGNSYGEGDDGDEAVDG